MNRRAAQPTAGAGQARLRTVRSTWSPPTHAPHQRRKRAREFAQGPVGYHGAGNRVSVWQYVSGADQTPVPIQLGGADEPDARGAVRTVRPRGTRGNFARLVLLDWKRETVYRSYRSKRRTPYTGIPVTGAARDRDWRKGHGAVTKRLRRKIRPQDNDTR